MTAGRVEGFDLLRGIAVGLVVLRHAFPEHVAGAGVVGVVMFFALSGHLITGVLLGELERTGRVDLRAFYARRARRLVPALLLLVAGVVVVTLLLDPAGERADLGRDVLVALTWTGNLPALTPDGATFHLWTLATEEQFYLLWPAVLAAAYARGRLGTAVLAAAAAAAIACLATVLWLREAPDLAYALPTSWAACFVLGAASRLLLARPDVPLLRHGLPATVPAVALSVLAVLSVVPLRGHALTYLAGGPVIAASTAVLLLSWRGWTTVSAPMLRPLVWLGTVSYGAYLWNYPLTVWLRPHVEHAGVLAAVLTVPLAALSWYAVERRWQRPRATAQREAVPA